MNLTAELVACPFCGNHAVRFADPIAHYVVCDECGAFGPTETVEPYGSAWNRRYFGRTLTSEIGAIERDAATNEDS